MSICQALEHGLTAMDLTERERAVVRYLIAGHTHEQIANGLGIAPSTVKNHITTIYRKTGVRNPAQLIWLLLGIDPAEIIAPIAAREMDVTLRAWRVREFRHRSR